MTAKVDGVEFEVRGSLFAVDSNTSSTESISIGVYYEDDSRAILMGISNLTAPGTYPVFDPVNADPDKDTYVSSFIYGEGEDNTWYATYLVGSIRGSISITELDAGFLSGTFQFTGTNVDDLSTRDVTEGKFRLKRI